MVWKSYWIGCLFTLQHNFAFSFSFSAIITNDLNGDTLCGAKYSRMDQVNLWKITFTWTIFTWYVHEYFVSCNGEVSIKIFS